MKTAKKILALDPANSCGYAHTSGRRGVWHLGSGDGRLVLLRNTLLQAADLWQVDLIAQEDATYGSEFASTQASHNELRGIIKLVCAELCIPWIGYKPTTIKKFATQSGKATKAQMMRACETILKIKPASDDEADAVWILEMAKIGYVPPSTPKKRITTRPPRSRRLF